MGALLITITLLEVTLLLSGLGFTESSELLQCFNDYDTELKCSFNSTEGNSCSENTLNVSLIIPKRRSFTCSFKETRSRVCECSIYMEGFVITEVFTINVLKGDKIWLTENITTKASIKPRRPIITSVIQRNGDFLITLNTTYTAKPFSESLVVELMYNIKGENKYMTQTLENGRTTYELVGRNLQPNSEYVLRARVKSNYPPNKTFSDFSEPYVFKTQLLQCFNDYDTELKCSFNSTEGNSCSENTLNVSLIISKHSSFTCSFKETRSRVCECSLYMVGFVITEVFTINVSKGDKIWLMKNITTEASIKPRRPIIMSVIQMNGDFLITLNTTYTTNTFSGSLVVELMYNIKGENKFMTQTLENGRTTYELVGRNLQPNSEYVLRARVKSNYPPNKTFSDFSEPYVFKTPRSLQNILRIIIPILCLILIICISSIYFWFNRILKPWWDKIPTPKFSTNFVKKVPQLLSFSSVQQFSSVSLDTTANHTPKKTWVESTLVPRDNSDNSLSLGTGSDSVPLIYSTTGYEDVPENSSEDVHLDQQDQEQTFNNQQSKEFSSGVSNRTYSQSSSSGSSFFKMQITNRLLLENQDSAIQMNNDYSIFNGCTDSGNSILTHMVMPTDHETVVLLGYGENQNALSSCDDSIFEKPFSSKKPQDAPFSIRDSVVLPADDGYQTIQSVS